MNLTSFQSLLLFTICFVAASCAPSETEMHSLRLAKGNGGLAQDTQIKTLMGSPVKEAPEPTLPQDYNKTSGKARSFSGSNGLFSPLPIFSDKLYKDRNNFSKGGFEIIPSPNELADPNVVSDFFINKTVASYSSQHGMQISYYSPDGKIYLWYPGNKVILSGVFLVEQRPTNVIYDHPELGRHVSTQHLTVVCYNYGSNSYNTMTGVRSAQECTRYSSLKAVRLESRTGDIFGLSKSPEPRFILLKDKTTLDNLLRK